MRQVYPEADTARVVAKRLMETSDTRRHLARLEILKGDWRTRLWTLQEGCE